MIQVTLTEAKTHLSRLIKAAQDGQEIIISRHNLPVAKLVALPRVALPQSATTRPLGWAGFDGFWMSDDFDAPPDDTGAGIGPDIGPGKRA